MSRKLDILKDLLKQIKIIYTDSDSYIQTIWKDKNLSEFAILLAIEQNWVNFISIINLDKLENKSFEEQTITLMHLNLRYLGPKFALDKKDRFILVYQQPLNMLTPEYMKRIFENYVNILNDLYYPE
jgi:hypothetical protein